MDDPGHRRSRRAGGRCDGSAHLRARPAGHDAEAGTAAVGTRTTIRRLLYSLSQRTGLSNPIIKWPTATLAAAASDAATVIVLALAFAQVAPAAPLPAAVKGPTPCSLMGHAPDYGCFSLCPIYNMHISSSSSRPECETFAIVRPGTDFF